jgi:DNA-directed RNA polymerase specialized sigma24 family protein
MAQRYTPTLECLEVRQVLAASPPLAGLAAAAPTPVPVRTVLQVAWAPYVFPNITGVVAPAAASGSSAPPAPGNAPQSPAAAPAGNAPAVDGPPSPGEPTAPTNPAPVEGWFPTKADESADRPRAGFPGLQPGGQEAPHPGDAGAGAEPTGRPGGDPPKGAGGSDRTFPDWPKPLPRLRSATDPRNQFALAPADGLTDETTPFSGALSSALHARPVEEFMPPGPGPGAAPGALGEDLAQFPDRKALPAFLANLGNEPVHGAVPVSGGQRPDGPPSAAPDDGTGVTPLVMGTALLPRGKPLDPVERGYQYLCQYARHSIHAAERRVGPLRDHDDLVQQVCVEWLEQAGPPAEALPRLLEQAPAEMQLLRAVVTRVIARAVYQQKKRSVVLDFNDWPARGNAAERDWAEFKADCEQGVGNLSRREWQVLDLRRQGKTFEEIGAELRLPRQRVWEVYRAVEARLREIYGKKDG